MSAFLPAQPASLPPPTGFAEAAGGTADNRTADGRATGRRLVWTIAAFASFMIAVLWGATTYKIELERTLEVEAINRENSNLARAFDEHTTRTLKSVDQAVLFLKFQYEKLGASLDIADYVREGMIISQIFNQLGVIDQDGQYILSNLPDFKKVYLGDREHFKVHVEKDSRELFVSKPVLGRASAKWSIQLTRRINRADGTFGGVVVVSLDPYYFSSFYSDVDLGKRGLVSLIGLDGVIRARRSGDNRAVGQDVSDGPLFQLFQARTHGSTVFRSPVDNVERFASYRVLKDYPFAVVVGVAQDEALEEFRARQWQYYAFAIAVTASILAFSGLMIALVLRLERTAARLRAAGTKAESANRMKSEFLASMSHELRTPLNGILGYAEFLRDDTTQPEHKESASTILASGRHLLDVVNSILDLAKIEAGHMALSIQEEALMPMIEGVVALHRPVAEQKKLELQLLAAPDLPTTIRCDRTRLVQILNNLLHNAVKFTDAGEIVVGVTQGEEHLRFEVRDTGCGIDPKDLDLIFERFQQADRFMTRRHGGTGLGLALAKELVAMMGGDIGVESAPGVGTSVFFRLPKQSESPARPLP
jgi:two-component system, NarL family, sensor histidine kinase BarA